MYKGFSHIDEKGNAYMVDISQKNDSFRTAKAMGQIHVTDEIIKAILNDEVAKGDVLGTARIAGIMAAKRTWELIPLCHPLMLSKCDIEFEFDEENSLIKAFSEVKVTGKTGVEMEALTGVSTALLTIYDMCKAMDKTMEISNIHLICKSGGKSGDFINEV